MGIFAESKVFPNASCKIAVVRQASFLCISQENLLKEKEMKTMFSEVTMLKSGMNPHVYTRT